jgi:hypothetical protein
MFGCIDLKSHAFWRAVSRWPGNAGEAYCCLTIRVADHRPTMKARDAKLPSPHYGVRSRIRNTKERLAKVKSVPVNPVPAKLRMDVAGV